MRIILVVGACGSGKTWVMKEVIKKCKLDTLGKVGMFYFHRNEKIVCLGKYDGSTFEGSDKLSMALMSDLDAFIKWAKGKIIVCEGDRFTNKTFVEKTKPNLTVISIENDGAAGRKKRKSSQTDRQIKAIATKVKNFTAKVVGVKHQCLNSEVALEAVCRYL